MRRVDTGWIVTGVTDYLTIDGLQRDTTSLAVGIPMSKHGLSSALEFAVTELGAAALPLHTRHVASYVLDSLLN